MDLKNCIQVTELIVKQNGSREPYLGTEFIVKKNGSRELSLGTEFNSKEEWIQRIVSRYRV